MTHLSDRLSFIVDSLRENIIVKPSTLHDFRNELSSVWDELKEGRISQQMDATNLFMFLNDHLSDYKLTLLAIRTHPGDSSNDDLMFEAAPNHSIMLQVPADDDYFRMESLLGQHFSDSATIEIERTINGKMEKINSTATRTIHPNFMRDTSVSPIALLDVDLDYIVPVLTVPVSLLRYRQGKDIKVKTHAGIRPYIALSVSSRAMQGQLRSIVVHQGANIQSGHYMTFVRDSNTDDFVLFNDRTVSFSQFSDIENMISTNGCLFFYDLVQ